MDSDVGGTWDEIAAELLSADTKGARPRDEEYDEG
jgi:hypothetical protein